MNNPRLIQTYLPDGTLEGVRVIELTQSTVKALVAPRIAVAKLAARNESSQPAIYILYSNSDGTCYFGESEKGLERVTRHARTKDFWDMCVLFVSKDNSLEKGDIKYLESLLIEKAKSTASVKILNVTAPPKNTIHEFKLHVLDSIIEDVAFIMKSLGYSVLEAKKTESEPNQEIWYCTSKKTIASAMYKGDKFVVLGSSTIDKSYAKSWAESSPGRVAERQKLLAEHGVDNGDVVELTQNVSFASPNQAAQFVTGRSINAWTAWKNQFGTTMDEVMRKGTT